MECCSDVHSHQDNHCLVDHNHPDQPYAFHNNFQEVVVDHPVVHLHNEAFVEALLEALEVALPYCYTSCVVEVPLEDVVDNCLEVLQGVQAEDRRRH